MRDKLVRRALPVLVMLVSVLLSACGGSSFVPEPTEKYFSVSLIEAESEVTIEDADLRHFRRKLEEALRDSFAIGNNSELAVTYRFISFEGATSVESVFTNRAGDELGKTNTDATVEGVLFGIGGSLEGALTDAAEEIAEYTIDNFAEE